MNGEQMPSLRTTTSRARTRVQRLLHDNSLLVAAAAMLTGAAFGGVLPQTEKEKPVPFSRWRRRSATRISVDVGGAGAWSRLGVPPPPGEIDRLPRRFDRLLPLNVAEHAKRQEKSGSALGQHTRRSVGAPPQHRDIRHRFQRFRSRVQHGPANRPDVTPRRRPAPAATASTRTSPFHNIHTTRPRGPRGSRW